MGELTEEFEVANDFFGNFLVQTGNACIIERIKATAQSIIVDMWGLPPSIWKPVCQQITRYTYAMFVR
jgi:hypothetical protein